MSARPSMCRLCLALLLACGAASAQEPEWKVLRIGNFHAGEAPAHPGTGWLALTVVDGKWHLVPAVVTATALPDLADEPPAATGVEIGTDAADAIALLRAPGLRSGKVDTPDMRFKSNARYFQYGSTMSIAFKGRQYRFEVRQKALDLTLGSTSQRLSDDVGAVDQDDSLSLVWAGDLDGDGQLDFLLAGTGKNSDSLCLYLSRAAAAGALVGAAGCSAGTGC